MRGIDQAVLTDRLKADQLFKAIIPLDFDKAAALCHSGLPFRSNRFDRLIAAHAGSTGLVLVTNKEADFADVPDLTVENWTL